MNWPQCRAVMRSVSVEADLLVLIEKFSNGQYAVGTPLLRPLCDPIATGGWVK